MRTPRLTNLKCEHSVRPLGVGTRTPRFSWEIEAEGEGKGLKQVACSVQAWRLSGEERQLVWESGRMDGQRQHEIIYGGEPLEKKSVFEWRARAWLNDGSLTEWSEPESFESGFFDVADWKAGWVAYRWCHTAPERQSVCFLRKEFEVENVSRLKRARAFVAASAGAHGNDTLRMNLYELRLNGAKVGRDLYNPGQLSEKKERALFRAFNLDGLLKEGANAVGVVFASKIVSVEILLEYEDGSVKRILSGIDWRQNKRGPFLRLWRHDVYEYGGKGEIYDAREEFEGWDKPGFDESSWGCVNNFTQPPGILAPQMQSVETFEVLKPASVVKRGDGLFMLDFGRCLNGHLALKARGPRGTEIHLRFAERLDDDGSPDFSTTLSAQLEKSVHEDVYIKRGDGVEPYAPRFANHSFRHVEVSGWSGELDAGDVEARAVCSAVGRESSFSCSDERVEKLKKLCENTFLSNFMSVQTDCPSRERQGWPGDAAATAPGVCALFDMRLLYEKWLDDMADEQFANGALPYLAPFPKILIGSELAWGDGFLTLVAEAWKAYGDLTLVERHYEEFRRWGAYLLSIREEDGLSRGHANYCDHLAKDYPSRVFHENAYAFHSFKTLELFAEALGRFADAARHASEAETLRNSINANLLKDGVPGLGTQSELVHALAFGIAPEELREELKGRLFKQLEEERFFRTGILGTSLLMRLLADEGRNDLAWKLVVSEKPRAWLDMIKSGATTATEEWAPLQGAGERRFSWNHPAFAGGLAAWLFRELGGVKPLAPGYAKIGMSPFAPEGVESAAVRIRTPLGFAGCAWRRKRQGFEAALEIPVGAEAEVRLPGERETRALGSGRYELSTKG